MDVRLDDDQVQLLRELLASTLSDLSYEISDTDNPGYKRGLRERREDLRAILAVLGGSPDSVDEA